MSKTQGDQQTQPKGLTFFRRIAQKGLTKAEELGQAVTDAAKKAFDVMTGSGRIDVSMHIPTLTEEEFSPSIEDVLQEPQEVKTGMLREFAVFKVSLRGTNVFPVRIVCGVPLVLVPESERIQSYFGSGDIFISAPIVRYALGRTKIPEWGVPTHGRITQARDAVGNIMVPMDHADQINRKVLEQRLRQEIEKISVEFGTLLFGARSEEAYNDPSVFVIENYVGGSFYDSRFDRSRVLQTARNESTTLDESLRLQPHQRIVHFRPVYDEETVPLPKSGKTATAKVGDIDPRGGVSVAFGLAKTAVNGVYAISYGVALCSKKDLFDRKMAYRIAVSRLRQADVDVLTKEDLEDAYLEPFCGTSYDSCFQEGPAYDGSEETRKYFKGYGRLVIRLPDELILNRTDGRIEFKGPSFPNQMVIAYLAAWVVHQYQIREENWGVVSLLAQSLESFSAEMEDRVFVFPIVKEEYPRPGTHFRLPEHTQACIIGHKDVRPGLAKAKPVQTVDQPAQ